MRGTGPDKATRELVLARDGRRCLTCGLSWALTVNHRINRGMGGSRLLNGPENLTTACEVCNSRYEEFPLVARAGGWKLLRGSDAAAAPVWDRPNDVWYVLNGDGTRTQVAA